MTSSPLLELPALPSRPGRKGNQHPRFEAVPTGLVDLSFGEEVLDLAVVARKPCLPWQERIVLNGNARDGDGLWSAFEVAVIAPRQNGKTDGVEKTAVTRCIRLGGPGYRLLWSAHEMKTATLSFERIEDLIHSNPRLLAQVKPGRAGWHRSHNEEGISFVNGSEMVFMARSGRSGRGFWGDTLIADEALYLDERSIAAALPTMNTRPNPQIWYMSSGGLADSEFLADIRARGIAADEENLYFAEWSAPVGADVDDREVWADANPSLGYLIAEATIGKAKRAMRSAPLAWAREYLGIWDENTVGGPFSEAVWEKLADVDSRIADDSPVAWGVEVSHDRAFGVIAAGGLRAVDDEVHVELVDKLPGTGWMIDRLVEMREADPEGVIVLDKSGPAGALLNDLQAALRKQLGLDDDGDLSDVLVVVSTDQYKQACGWFFDRVKAGQRLHHVGVDGQPDLAASVAALEKRKIGDGFGWDRFSDDDVASAGAATLAGWAVSGASEPVAVEDTIW